jgi:hypothetical protein
MQTATADHAIQINQLQQFAEPASSKIWLRLTAKQANPLRPNSVH